MKFLTLMMPKHWFECMADRQVPSSGLTHNAIAGMTRRVPDHWIFLSVSVHDK
jgi:hypothetical protein